jgi:hypothetical protein
VSLGDYQCYARLWAGGERLPVFSLRLDPPPVSDPELAGDLAADSARRWGRPRAAVEAARTALLERIDAARAQATEQEQRRRAEPPPPPPDARGNPSGTLQGGADGPPPTTPALPFGPSAGPGDTACLMQTDGKDGAE